MIGESLDHYRILERIGEGGMGIVYLARDEKLRRKVALKVLPGEVASDNRRLERFQREAETLAALDHPNIVTIYSVEESDGVHYLTMAFVEGQTLDWWIPAGGMGLDKFFEISVPLADALAAAHDKGITHRDLKPQNILISEGGQVKVLDFGLAKLRSPESAESSGSATTLDATSDLHVVGTVPYMSPEQAAGRQVDYRSDIFSLGIIFYRMLTGKLPFKGDSSMSMATSIIRDDPAPLTELRPELPRHLSRMLSLCLTKAKEHRYQSAADVRNELTQLQREIASGETPVTGAMLEAASRRPWSWKQSAVLLAVVLGGIAIGYLWLQNRIAKAGEALIAVDITMTRATDRPGSELFPSLSPDRSFLAYAAREGGDWDIHLQRVGGRKLINLTHDSPFDDTHPALSPDGERIAFRSERDGGGIFVMGATGEDVKHISDFGFNPAWLPDGSALVFATEPIEGPETRSSVSHLWLADLISGDRSQLTETDAVQPNVSPSGGRIAYWARSDSGGQRNLFTIPVTGGPPVQLTDTPSVDWHPVWSPDGRFLYFGSDRNGAMNLWRLPIDERTGRARGAPQPITTAQTSETRHFAVSRDGKVVALVSQVKTKHVSRIELDPAGETAIGKPELVTAGSLKAHSPEPSPVGPWVAFHSTGTPEDIFVVNIDTGEQRQLTDDTFVDRSPRWSPSGDRIAFYSDRSGAYNIWTVRPDGSQLEQITDAPDAAYAVWSPDGTRMAFPSMSLGPSVVDLTEAFGDRRPIPLPRMEEEGTTLLVWSWSSDGRFLAGHRVHIDGGTGGLVLYDLAEERYRVLTESGEFPVWLADNRRLLFWQDGDIRLLDVFDGREPRTVFPMPGWELQNNFGYSPKTNLIYFAHSFAEADIWLLNLG